MLILDEADRMLDMGFQDSVDAIVDQIPGERQTLLFSATFPDQIQSMSTRVMKTPKRVTVAETHDDTSIEQHFYQVTDNKQRLQALRLLLMKFAPEATVVFCNTRKETQEVADKLNQYGFSALALHGDLEQRDRDIILVRFANKSVSILVATDVAARGLDIDALDAVINYHIAHDAEMHTHRIGRTGRAGRSGIACSLYSDSEAHKVALLGTDIDPILEAEPLPPVTLLDKPPIQPVMLTLRIDGGKKQKVRPGDILGALTGKKGIAGKQVGKIKIFENWSYVAVNHKVAKAALQKLMHGKLKGRTFRARLIEDD
jgi:ATP-independent RNA helicase DbpA